MRFETRDLQYFAAIAEHGSLGRAAEKLALSQPALSRSLGRLERSVQAKLVRRTSRGVELTAAGETLLKRISHLHQAFDDVAREVSDVSGGRAGHLRVGAGGGISGDLLGAVYKAFARVSPRVTVHIVADVSENLMRMLLSGELDLVISRAPAIRHDELSYEHLFEQQMVVVAAPGHRLSKRKRISLSDLAAEHWALSPVDISMWQWMRQAFDERGFTAPRVMLSVPTGLRLPIIASSDLLGFSERGAASTYGLAELSVKELQWIRRMAVAYRKDAYQSPAAKRFIDALTAKATRWGQL